MRYSENQTLTVKEVFLKLRPAIIVNSASYSQAGYISPLFFKPTMTNQQVRQCVASGRVFQWCAYIVVIAGLILVIGCTLAATTAARDCGVIKGKSGTATQRGTVDVATEAKKEAERKDAEPSRPGKVIHPPMPITKNGAWPDRTKPECQRNANNEIKRKEQTNENK